MAETAAAPILGKWELVSSENYDEFLKAIGVGIIKRKLACSVTPVINYTQINGANKINQKITTAIKNLDMNFEFDVEFEETLADDRKAKALIRMEGNKFIHTQTFDNDKYQVTIIREFNTNDMTTTFSIGSIVSTHKFKRIA